MSGTDQVNVVTAATVEGNAEVLNHVLSSLADSAAVKLLTSYGGHDSVADHEMFSNFFALREEKAAEEKLYVKDKANGDENPLKQAWVNALSNACNEAVENIPKIANPTEAPTAGTTTVSLWEPLTTATAGSQAIADTAHTVTYYDLDLGAAAVEADADNGVEAADAEAATFKIRFVGSADANNRTAITMTDDNAFTLEELKTFLSGSIDEGNFNLTGDDKITPKAYKGIMRKARISGHLANVTLKQMSALFSSKTYTSACYTLPSPNYVNRPKLEFQPPLADAEYNVPYRFEIVKQQSDDEDASTARFQIIAVPAGGETLSGGTEVYERKTELILGAKGDDVAADPDNGVEEVIQAEVPTTTVVTNEFLRGSDFNEVVAFYDAAEINDAVIGDHTQYMYSYPSATAKQELNLDFDQNLKDVGAVLNGGVFEFTLQQYIKAYNQTSVAKRTLATINDLSDKIKPVGDSWSAQVLAVNDNAGRRLKYAIGQANKHKAEIADSKTAEGDVNYALIFEYTGFISESTVRKGLVVPKEEERLILTADYSLYTSSATKSAPSAAKMQALASWVLEEDANGDPDLSRLQASGPQDSDLTLSTPETTEGAADGTVMFNASSQISNINALANIFADGTTTGSGKTLVFADPKWGATHNGKIAYDQEGNQNSFNKSKIAINSMKNIKANNKFSSAAVVAALKEVITVQVADDDAADAEGGADILTADQIVRKIAGPSADVVLTALEDLVLTEDQHSRLTVRTALKEQLAEDEFLDNAFINANEQDLLQSFVKEWNNRTVITEGRDLLSTHALYYSPLVYGKRDTLEEMKVAIDDSGRGTIVANDVPVVSVIGSSRAVKVADQYAEIIGLTSASSSFAAKLNYLFAWTKGHVAPADETANLANLEQIIASPGFSVVNWVSIPMSGAIKVTETEEVTNADGEVTTPYSVEFESDDKVEYVIESQAPHKLFLDKAITEKQRSRSLYLKMKTMPANIEDLSEALANKIASNADAINEDRISDIITSNVNVSANLQDAYRDLVDFALICGVLGFKALEARILSATIGKLNALDESLFEKNDDDEIVKSLVEVKIDFMESYISGSVSVGAGDNVQFNGTLTVDPQLPSTMGTGNGEWSNAIYDQVVLTSKSKTLSPLFADLNINPLKAFEFGTADHSIRHVALMALTKDTIFQGDIDLLRSVGNIDATFLAVATEYFTSEYKGSGRSLDGDATDTLVFDRNDISTVQGEVGTGAAGEGSFVLSSNTTI